MGNRLEYGRTAKNKCTHARMHLDAVVTKARYCAYYLGVVGSSSRCIQAACLVRCTVPRHPIQNRCTDLLAIYGTGKLLDTGHSRTPASWWEHHFWLVGNSTPIAQWFGFQESPWSGPRRVRLGPPEPVAGRRFRTWKLDEPGSNSPMARRGCEMSRPARKAWPISCVCNLDMYLYLDPRWEAAPYFGPLNRRLSNGISRGHPPGRRGLLREYNI